MHSQTYTNSLSYMCNGTTFGPTIHGDRQALLASLLKHTGLDRKCRYIQCIDPMRAAASHLLKFHDEDYLNTLNPEGNRSLQRRLRKESGGEEAYSAWCAEYDLVDDCELPDCFEGMRKFWQYNSALAGASLHACGLITANQSSRSAPGSHIAINWGGGRHHAHRGKAGGFCFVNDTVLALLQLRRKLRRVLYLDIDIHHADGVQEAFYDTDSVMTVSFHKFAPGFFPGTPHGHPKHVGRGKGLNHNLNIPLPRGTSDLQFLAVFKRVFAGLWETYDPEGVVLAVGADGLGGDPIVGEDGWKLTSRGLAAAVEFVR